MYHRPVETAPEPPSVLLPPVIQPKGFDFVLKTWSGRLIAINVLVFILEILLSPKATLSEIPVAVLIQMGAKESVLLARGEWWRFVTPMFLHGNLLHLLFNNWALYAVAYPIEALLGARKFLLLYLLAGLGGNVLSSVWSLSLSVGASGALFGLLGCAWYFERTIQQRVKELTGSPPKAGAYTVMVVANILFGFIVPQIDNAAHMGGLAVGVTTAYIILRATPNRLMTQHLLRARIGAGAAGIALVVLAIVGASPYYVKWRLARALGTAERPVERYYFLGRLLELDAGDAKMLWQHLRLALELKDFRGAAEDFKLLSADPEFERELSVLDSELMARSDGTAAEWLREKRRATPN